jgi:hypothetical protein
MICKIFEITAQERAVLKIDYLPIVREKASSSSSEYLAT